MARTHTIRLSQAGVAQNYPMLKSQSSPHGRIDAGDTIAVLSEDGSRTYPTRNKMTTYYEPKAKDRVGYVRLPGYFDALSLKNGDVIEISGKRNLLAGETTDPEPLYVVVVERGWKSLTAVETPSPEAAHLLSREVLAGKDVVRSAEADIGR